MTALKHVIIPYEPRPLWKQEIHSALDAHRFAVLVCHRRFGKTVGTINQTIRSAVKCNLRSPQYAYIAPFFKQAKMVAWNYLKYYAGAIPGIKINSSDYYVELPTKHSCSPGARIYLVGADNPDGLRGTYWDGAILDEFPQMKNELWGEIIRPALSDRNGWAIFIGTPKGQNQFYEIYNKARTNKDWYTCLYRADESGIISPEELESMKQSMTDAEIRQELYCDFTASAYNVLISIDMVSEATKKVINKEDIAGMPLVFGVDVARFGDDRSVLFARQGLYAHEPIIFKQLNNMELASRIAFEIDRQNPDAIFIDAGRGEGVIDRLRQLGYRNVFEIPFGGKAANEKRYVNKRSEMWDKGATWIKQGGAIPANSDFKTELTTPEYTFDNYGRIKLEPKDKIKERMGSSPDLADAFMLTFAENVVSKTDLNNPLLNKRMTMCNTEYDPLKI